MNIYDKSKKIILMLLFACVALLVAFAAAKMQPDGSDEPSVPAYVPDIALSESDIIETQEPTSAAAEQTDTSATASETAAVTTTTTNTTTTTATTTTTTAAVATTTTTATATTTTAPTTAAQKVQVDTSRYECSGRLTVTVDSANVRKDADKDAALVGVIHRGESYEVVSQKPSNTGILWFEIKINDTTGYVAGTYVEYDGRIVGGKAYLTFDDGPSANTLKILDTLDKYGAKATFFVIHHSGQENVYREIVKRGHTIALHSYTHDYSQIYKNNTAYFDDLSRLDDFVSELTGVHSKYIRFPGGSSNTVSKNYCKGVMSSLTANAGSRGYRYYDWDVDSGDAEEATVKADTIFANVKNGMRNRREAIILMHDTKAKTTTAEILPKVIEFLQGKGFELLAIDDSTHQSHQRVNN